MLSKHAGGEVPWVLWVKRVRDGYFSRFIGPALLEVITLCDLFIVVTGPAGLPRAVRRFAVDGQRTAVETSQHDLLVLGFLCKNRDRKKKG